MNGSVEQPASASAAPDAKRTGRGRVRGRQRSWLGNRLWPVLSYVVTNLTVSLFWVFFRVLNRTTVIGREHVGDRPNTILLSNHQTMIDSFLVGLLAFFPRSLVKPHLIPWNPAAEENFFKNPVLAWFSDHFKCIPVKAGRRDLHALHRMVEVLPHGVMTLFPEGTRTRDGSVGQGRAGAGLVILGTRPRVIPVAIDGMQDVLPIGRHLPRMLKRIYVSYGPPVEYGDFLDQPRSREAAQAIVDRVMDAVRRQHGELRARRARDEGNEYPPSRARQDEPS